MENLSRYIEDQFIIEQFKYIDANLVTESLNCKLLQDLAKQLKQQRKDEEEKIKNSESYNSYIQNKSFKQIFGNSIRWDKVTNDDISIYYNENNDADKMVRKVIQQKTPAFLIIQDPDTKDFEYAILTWGNVINLKDRRSHTAGESLTVRISSRRWKDLSLSEKVELTHGKTLYFINIEGKFDEINSLHRDRNLSKSGMVLFDEVSLKRMAEENVKRYKAIIAKRHAENDNNDKLIDEANEIITLVSNLATKVAKDPIKQADMIQPLSELTLYIYDVRKYVNGYGRNHWQGYYSGVNGILPMMMKYIEYKNKTAKNGDSYYNDSLKTYKKELENSINKAKELIDKYDLKAK